VVGGNAVVQFYETPGSLTPHVGTIAVDQFGGLIGEHIAGADLFVGKLTSAPPAWVPRYPLIKRPETYNYEGSPRVNEEIFAVGRGLADSFTEVRVGTNQIAHSRLHEDKVVATVPTKTYAFHYNPEIGPNEAQTLDGDSGAPSFAVTHAGLTLAGIHSASLADTSISYFINEIVAAVPEELQVVTDLPGDLNYDFAVNALDYNILADNWNNPTPTLNEGDINRDGDVNALDYNILADNFTDTLQPPADFEDDWDVDVGDFTVIVDNWQEVVTPGFDGDADGSGFVNEDDFNKMNETWLFDYTSDDLPSPPPIAIPADFNDDGLRNPADFLILQNHFGDPVDPGENGDVNGDGQVNAVDYNLFLNMGYKGGGVADLNNDNRIDTGDLETFLLAIGTSSPSSSLGSDGDFNEDGSIDADDFKILGQYWGLSIDRSLHLPLPPVPEPNSITLFMLALAAVLYRRDPAPSVVLAGAGQRGKLPPCAAPASHSAACSVSPCS
jgi:hypothetical protein